MATVKIYNNQLFHSAMTTGKTQASQKALASEVTNLQAAMKKQAKCWEPEQLCSHLKMDGWKTLLSYWVSSYFQGAFAVSFREGIFWRLEVGPHLLESIHPSMFPCVRGVIIWVWWKNDGCGVMERWKDGKMDG